jgi:hypothetical protein
VTGSEHDSEEGYVVTASFETSAPQYAWLQRAITIGMGGITPHGGVD